MGLTIFVQLVGVRLSINENIVPTIHSIFPKKTGWANHKHKLALPQNTPNPNITSLKAWYLKYGIIWLNDPLNDLVMNMGCAQKNKKEFYE